jgi:uncharacterized protein
MNKLDNLKSMLIAYGKVAIAFSGGVDSSFLLKVACDTVGKENVFPITLRSSVNPEAEMDEAECFLKELKVEYKIIDVDIFSIPEFKYNPIDRCYICKKQIFQKIIAKAAEKGFDIVMDGTNADDEGDYRPGMKALAELNVKSPLKSCGMTKEEIRKWSQEMALHTWNKPSLACLASRIPYGEEISEEKLKRVEKAEQYLLQLGFTQLRVRCHENLARIELLPNEMISFFEKGYPIQVEHYFKQLGFKYVSLDLKGYRTGSMNEILNKE